MAKKTNNDIFYKTLDFILDNKIFIIVILLSCGMGLANKVFFAPENIINVTRQICVSAIIGLGFTIVVTSQNIDLSVGTMLGLIGVIMAKLSLIDGMPILIALFIGIIVGAMLGYLNGFLVTFFRLNGFVLTIATQLVFKGACYLIANNSAVGNLSDEFKMFGQSYVWFIPVPVIILILTTVVIAILLYRTKFGRYVVAVGGNPEAARVSGINVNSIIRSTYMIMGICAAIGAIVMTGRLGSAQQTAGQGMELDAIAAVVLGGTRLYGGKGKVVGTIFGCLTVGIINNGLNLAHVNPNWQILTKGLLIIIAIIVDAQSDRIFSKLRKRMMKLTTLRENTEK